jgi:hypothetical protein
MIILKVLGYGRPGGSDSNLSLINRKITSTIEPRVALDVKLPVRRSVSQCIAILGRSMRQLHLAVKKLFVDCTGQSTGYGRE